MKQLPPVMNKCVCSLSVVLGAMTATAPVSAIVPSGQFGGGWDSYTASEPIVSVPLGNTSAGAPDLNLDSTYLKFLAGINETLSAAEFGELAQIRPFDEAADDAERMMEFAQVRRAVLDAIHLLGFDEPRIADSLYSLYANRRLSVASGVNFRNVDATLREDGRRTYGDEALNLFDFPCSDTPLVPIKYYDPQMLKLINLLYYQGRLTTKSGYEGPFPNTQLTWAQYSLALQLREVSVATDEVARLDALILVMQSIIANAILPPSITGLPYRIGDSILRESGLTIEQKKDLARALLLALEGELRPLAEFYRQQRLFYQLGLEHYIGGLITQSVYNEFMRPTAWYARSFKRPTGEFRRITVMAGSGTFTAPPGPLLVTNTDVRQVAARVDGTKIDTTFNITGLANISGAYRTGNILMVAGNSSSTAEGVVRGYLDTNDDGLVEENTGRELHRSTEFHGNLNFFRNPVTGLSWGFNRTSYKMFEFTGSDTDGFPTGFVDRGTLHTAANSAAFPRDRLYARLSYNVDWAVGYSDYKVPEDKYRFNIQAQYSFGSGTYSYYRRSYSFEEAELGVALVEPAWTGANWLRGTGTPGHQLEAYRVDGASLTFLDQAQVDPNSQVAFNLPFAIGLEQKFTIKDLSTNLFSPTYTSPRSAESKFTGVRKTGDGAVQFETFGHPNYNYLFYYGDEVNSTDYVWDGRLSRTGRTSWEISLDGNPFIAVGGATFNPPLGGNTTYFRTAPGSWREYHPQIDDNYGDGAAFSLITPTNLDPERLSFSVFGSFNYAALSAEANFSLTYEMELLGQNSANIMAILKIDYQSLVDPPVVRLPGTTIDVVLAPCLVIGGKNYPMYQFLLANNPADNCGQPHWHRPTGLVYSLETPNTGIPDPDLPNCGFGKESVVPKAIFPAGVQTWIDFKAAHPPLFPPP